MKEFFEVVRSLFAANLGMTFAANGGQYSILRFCGGNDLYDLQKGQVVKIETLQFKDVIAIVHKLEEMTERREKAND